MLNEQQKMDICAAPILFYKSTGYVISQCSFSVNHLGLYAIVYS
jgi:hypothetical protein